MFRLCECGYATGLAAWLDALPEEGVGASGHTGMKCPGCGTTVELVLKTGRIALGYTYAAGSTHFETLREVRVAGLRVVSGDPDDLDVHLEGRHWHFGVRQDSHLRFVILAAAWARGRRLAELDFSPFGVVVEALERDRRRVAPEPEWLLEDGDFLHLAGPSPALTKAWFYMNDGPG